MISNQDIAAGEELRWCYGIDYVQDHLECTDKKKLAKKGGKGGKRNQRRNWFPWTGRGGRPHLPGPLIAKIIKLIITYLLLTLIINFISCVFSCTLKALSKKYHRKVSEIRIPLKSKMKSSLFGLSRAWKYLSERFWLNFSLSILCIFFMVN